MIKKDEVFCRDCRYFRYGDDGCGGYIKGIKKTPITKENDVCRFLVDNKENSCQYFEGYKKDNFLLWGLGILILIVIIIII